MDDAIFSESYVRTAMRTSDKGPTKCGTTIKAKGIMKKIFSMVLTFKYVR
ncbi:MAG: RecX family transcriptional regulator [Enterobacter sp.]